jgi:signal peptide peptidase SppA
MFGLFTRAPVVPVLRLQGAIGMASPLRPGLSLAALAGPLEKAFHMSRLPSVALIINSPGGSAAQSNLIFNRIRSLADEHEKRVYAFCEDVAASGGYYLALAGDEIHADPASIVGSIGVVSAGFGFVDAIEKLGIERRVYTAGTSKAMLDPFRPERAEDVERLKAMQAQIHAEFIKHVEARRAGKLRGEAGELFSGAFWAGREAMALGLVDGLEDVRSRMRALHGDKVQLKVVPMVQGGLLARLRRLPGFAAAGEGEAGATFAEEAIAALETRALWARYGV